MLLKYKSMVSEVDIIYKSSKQIPKAKITCAKDVYEYAKAYIFNPDKIEHVEFFYILLLNQAHNTIGFSLISQGGVTGTVVDAKIIFQTALKSNARSIVLMHNHPSGALKASQADKDITKKIKDGAKLLDMQVLDHLIVTNDGYMSFGEEGLI